MTDAEIIEALGGGTKLSKALSDIGADVDREAIYAWVIRDFIPWQWRIYVATVADAQKVSLPDGFLTRKPPRPPKSSEAMA